MHTSTHTHWAHIHAFMYHGIQTPLSMYECIFHISMRSYLRLACIHALVRSFTCAIINAYVVIIATLTNAGMQLTVQRKAFPLAVAFQNLWFLASARSCVHPSIFSTCHLCIRVLLITASMLLMQAFARVFRHLLPTHPYTSKVELIYAFMYKFTRIQVPQ
jgi:hypothetical protein